MQRGPRFLLWLLATLATTAIAYVAVSAAGSEVNDRPLTGVIAVSAASTTSTSTLSPTSTLSSTTLPPTSTGSTSSSTTNVTNATSSTTRPTTTTAPTTTPTTAAAWQQTTINSPGGSMIVSYRPTEVRFESVFPQPGFAYEINDVGPDRVEVEFENGDAKYRLRAEWTSSGFVTEVDADED